MSLLEGVAPETIRSAVNLFIQRKSAAEVFVETTGLTLQQVLEIELLLKPDKPLVDFNRETGAEASRLDYNVPCPSSYRGRNFIFLEFEVALFSEVAKNPTS